MLSHHFPVAPDCNRVYGLTIDGHTNAGTATIRLDLQAISETLPIEVPDWLVQRWISVPAAGALARALNVWWDLRPPELTPAITALIGDEILRWRVSEFVNLPHRSRQAQKLRAAIDKLHCQGFGRLSLGHMAAAACLTPYHFCRLFKANFEVTPGQLIRRRLLLQGADLLACSGAQVSQIALGLDMSLPYFCSQCRQHYGMPPRSLRNWLTLSEDHDSITPHDVVAQQALLHQLEQDR